MDRHVSVFTISGFANTFFEVIAERKMSSAEVDEKTAEASDDEEDFESEEERRGYRQKNKMTIIFRFI